jgi:hypothetical protein
VEAVELKLHFLFVLFKRDSLTIKHKSIKKTCNLNRNPPLHGSFADIDWANGPYFLKTDIDLNGGNDYSITSVQQLLSVPYALYAKDAGMALAGITTTWLMSRRFRKFP